jgi:Mg2+ and Co2+ transporter CorA
MALELDFERRALRSLDPPAAVEAAAGGRFVWIDVDVADPGEGRVRLAALGLIDDEAIERIVAERPVAELVHAPEGLQIALTDCRPAGDAVVHQRVDLVLGESFLVTAHRGPSALAAEIARHLADDFERFARTPGFLLYEVGARLIDGYRGALKRLDEGVESLQERVVVASDVDAVAEIPALERDLLRLRRVMTGARDVLSELGDRRSPFVSETTGPFLSAQAAALDRLQQDAVASREVVAGTMGLQIAITGSRASRALGRLTGVTVIFLPMLFVVQTATAGLDWRSPRVAFWAIAALWIVAVVWYMRRHRLL